MCFAMNVTDVSPVQIDQPGYETALELLFLLVALFSFFRVSTYAMQQARQHTLVDSIRSPQKFEVPALGGFLFAAFTLLLLFLQSPIYMLLVVAGIWIFLTAARRTADYQFGLGRMQGSHIFRWSVLVCGAVFFLEIPLSHVVDRVMTFLNLPHPEQRSVEIFRQFRHPTEIGLFLLQAVTLSPLIEELFFRGFLYSFLKRFTHTWAAIVLSAGVFAFAHANLGSVLQLWLLGVVLGAAYEHTGSLLFPIAIHGCFNFITAISLLVEKGFS
jgi:membrane protease YdiL (CAAX protease family)